MGIERESIEVKYIPNPFLHIADEVQAEGSGVHRGKRFVQIGAVEFLHEIKKKNLEELANNFLRLDGAGEIAIIDVAVVVYTTSGGTTFWIDPEAKALWIEKNSNEPWSLFDYHKGYAGEDYVEIT